MGEVFMPASRSQAYRKGYDTGLAFLSIMQLPVEEQQARNLTLSFEVVHGVDAIGDFGRGYAEALLDHGVEPAAFRQYDYTYDGLTSFFEIGVTFSAMDLDRDGTVTPLERLVDVPQLAYEGTNALEKYVLDENIAVDAFRQGPYVEELAASRELVPLK